MAKKELFEPETNKVLRFLVHILGAFAVNREKRLEFSDWRFAF